MLHVVLVHVYVICSMVQALCCMLVNKRCGVCLAGAAVKGRLVVSFVNEQGMLEAGLDYGGLVKEFLEQVATTHCISVPQCLRPFSFILEGSLSVVHVLPTLHPCSLGL